METFPSSTTKASSTENSDSVATALVTNALISCSKSTHRSFFSKWCRDDDGDGDPGCFLIYSACLNRNVEQRITLLEILKHPWMRRHQHVVTKQAPAAAQFAIAQAAILLTVGSHLQLNGSYEQSAEIIYPSASNGIIIDNNHSNCNSPQQRQEQQQQLQQQPQQQQLLRPTQAITQSSGSIINNSDILRTSSDGSYASSGYFTRSNSLVWEEERRRLEAHHPLLTTAACDPYWLLQWREPSPDELPTSGPSSVPSGLYLPTSPFKNCIFRRTEEAQTPCQFDDPTDFFDGITINPRSTCYSPSISSGTIKGEDVS